MINYKDILVYTIICLSSLAIIVLLDITPTKILKSGDEILDRGISRYIQNKNKKLSIKELVSPKKAKKVRTVEDNEKTQKRIKNLVFATAFFVLSLYFANKTFLAIPIIYAMMNIPLIAARYYKNAIQKREVQQLEKALSMITSSYIRNKNVLASIKENINEIDEPLKQKFDYFLWKYEEINPSIETNLQELDTLVNHFIAHEWFVALINCKRDSSLVSTLYPIVNKLSSIRSAQLRMESKMNTCKQSLFTLAVLYFLSVPIFYFFDPEWVLMLLNTQLGNIVLALTSTLTLYALKNGIDKIESNEYQSALKGVES